MNHNHARIAQHYLFAYVFSTHCCHYLFVHIFDSALQCQCQLAHVLLAQYKMLYDIMLLIATLG